MMLVYREDEADVGGQMQEGEDEEPQEAASFPPAGSLTGRLVERFLQSVDQYDHLRGERRGSVLVVVRSAGRAVCCREVGGEACQERSQISLKVII